MQIEIKRFLSSVNNKYIMVEERASPYQEGGFQLSRLNSLLEKINMLNLNLMAFNDDIGQYNYQIKFDCLNTLFSEVASLVSSDEKKKEDRYKKVIDNLLLGNSPHQEKKVIGGWGTIKKEMQFSLKNFESLKKILYEHELFVKDLLHKYFRGGTNVEDNPKTNKED